MVKIEFFPEPETTFSSFKGQYKNCSLCLTEDPLLVIENFIVINKFCLGNGSKV